jgi:hypothetical protein
MLHFQLTSLTAEAEQILRSMDVVWGRDIVSGGILEIPLSGVGRPARSTRIGAPAHTITQAVLEFETNDAEQSTRAAAIFATDSFT